MLLPHVSLRKELEVWTVGLSEGDSGKRVIIDDKCIDKCSLMVFWLRNIALASQKLGKFDDMKKACDEVLNKVNPESVSWQVKPWIGGLTVGSNLELLDRWVSFLKNSEDSQSDLRFLSIRGHTPLSEATLPSFFPSKGFCLPLSRLVDPPHLTTSLR